MTAGMKSSEFWMVLVSVVVKWLGPHFGADFPNEGLLAVIGYAIGRGIAKFGKA